MTDTQTGPWPDWLADLTPERRVSEIVHAVAACYGSAPDPTARRLYISHARELLLRLLDETRAEPAARLEAARTDMGLFLGGLGGAGWLRKGTPGREAEDRLREFAAGGGPAAVAPAGSGLPAGLFAGHAPRECGEHRTLGRRAWCCDCSEYCYPDIDRACTGCRIALVLPVPSAERAQLAQAVAALRRLALDEPMTAIGDDGEPGHPEAELAARREHAAGTLETIGRLPGEQPTDEQVTAAPGAMPGATSERTAAGCEPMDRTGAEGRLPAAMLLLEQASLIIRHASDAGQVGGPGADSWRDGYQAFAAECAAGKAEPALPLVPEGTYVHAAIKGFIERDGYLFTGQWLGDPHMVVLRDRDGAFADVFPRSSVHLISAQPEPGSEPEQPDPWTQTIAEVRAYAAVLRRDWQGDRDKLIALRTWLESFLEGDAALAEVLAIFERDFRPREADEEAPF